MNFFEVRKDFEEFKNLNYKELILKLTKPTLFIIEGKNKEGVLISTLMHGDEPCGLEAFLDVYPLITKLEKSIYLFIGNIEAAKKEKRLITYDFNRIFLEDSSNDIQKDVNELLDYLNNINLISHIDFHSYNSLNGNPHSIIYNDRDLDFFSIFTKDLLLQEYKLGMLAEITSIRMPAILVECGTNLSLDAKNNAIEYLKRFLSYYNYLGYSFTKPNQILYNREVNIRTKNSNFKISSDADLLNLFETNDSILGVGSINDFYIYGGYPGIRISDILYQKGEYVYFRDNLIPYLISTKSGNLTYPGFYVSFKFKEIIN